LPRFELPAGGTFGSIPYGFAPDDRAKTTMRGSGSTFPRASRLGALLAGLAVLSAACVKLPDIEVALARARAQPETSKLFAADGTLITELHAEENREPVALAQVPMAVRQAVIAIEDARFYDHPGVDARAIVRAFFRNSEAGHIVEGGSTITQQYLKNLLVETERTFKRKVQEAALAYQLEKKYSKDEILERYLNTVYFGQGAYGIQAAAETFFSEDAKDLTLPQGALLAGLIKSPSRFDPIADPKASLDRRNLVLKHMREQAYITEVEEAKVRKAPLGIRLSTGGQRYEAAYFVEWVKQLIQRDPRFDALGPTVADRVNALFKGGLRIYTTVDLRLQKAAEAASRTVLDRPSDPYNAFVGLDPRSGAVVAMVGGRDFFSTTDRFAKFNLAVQSRRQPGSSFKPFTLAAALESGIPLERTFRGGSVIRIPLPDGQTWTVHNYDSISFGSRLSLREATVKSVNVVYAQVVRDIGPEKIVDVAQRMGIVSPLKPLYAIAIGAQEVSPLEMAGAYAGFANGGFRVDPQGITKITDSSGKVLWEWKPARRKAIAPGVAGLVTDALQDVVKFGTGRREQLDRQVAGKTGTADNYHDAWFAGYVPQLVGVSWVGFPASLRPMYPPYTRIRVVGGSWPGKIWKLFMQEALKGVPAEDFPDVESQLVKVRIDVSRNCLPNQFTPPYFIREITFIKGSEPTAICTEPTSGVISATPNVVGKLQSDAYRLLGVAGYRVRVEKIYCPSYPPGYVCDQTPDAGTPGTVGDSATIIVSADDVTAVVPQVLGLSRTAARNALEGAGFVVEIVAQDNPNGPIDISGCRDKKERRSDHVWLQSACAGEAMKKGSVVRIYVSP
jgi:penicillin-binding protein 1A